MKATGIIRRTDDLGRIVIPKEIRKIMNIYDGCPMEIIIDNGMVCYKKYQSETEYMNTAKNMLENLLQDVDIDISKKDLLKLKMEEIISLLKE